MERAFFKAGENMLTQGEEGDTAFLILSGSAEVLVGEGEHEKSVATLGEGDVFGEMSIVSPGPRSATIRAIEDTECAVTSYEDFLASVRHDPDVAIQFMKTLVGRLRKMNEMLSTYDPEHDLKSMLWDWVAGGDDDDDLTDEERQQRLKAYSTPIF